MRGQEHLGAALHTASHATLLGEGSEDPQTKVTTHQATMSAPDTLLASSPRSQAVPPETLSSCTGPARGTEPDWAPGPSAPELDWGALALCCPGKQEGHPSLPFAPSLLTWRAGHPEPWDCASTSSGRRPLSQEQSGGSVIQALRQAGALARRPQGSHRAAHTSGYAGTGA